MHINLKSILFDFKIIGKDAMMRMAFLAPVFLYLIIILGYPPLQKFLFNEYDLNITPFLPMVIVFFICLIPMMYGIVYGFLMLDERDEGIIMFISVTPTGKSGYLVKRMLIPVLISILFIFIFLLLTDQIHKHSLLKNFIWILTMSLQAPLMLLFLAAFASNKVEGIALSKAFGILLMAVIIDYVFDSPLEWLGFFSPLFWLEKAYFTATSLQFYAYTGAAIILSSFTTAFLLKKFQNKQF